MRFKICFVTCIGVIFLSQLNASAESPDLVGLADDSCRYVEVVDGSGYYIATPASHSIDSIKGSATPAAACDDECGPCPPIYVISINGVNSDVDSDFHEWVRRNTPGGIYRHHDPYGGNSEWCSGNPSKAADNLREDIEAFKDAHPCAKVIVIGHSLGGTAAWYLRDSADCALFIDPPTDCYPGGPIFCPSQTDICDSINDGIKDDPGYIPTDEHTPFSDPQAHCEDLRDIRDAIDSCIEQLRPGCSENEPLDPAPDCDPTPTPTPTPKPTPTPPSGPSPCGSSRVRDSIPGHLLAEARASITVVAPCSADLR